MCHYEWAKEQISSLKCNINPIQYAYDLFQFYYNTNIAKLLEITEGAVWENKLKPQVIVFNYNNDNHMEFIYKTVELFDNSITHI